VSRFTHGVAACGYVRAPGLVKAYNIVAQVPEWTHRQA
jgi:hypothetical protein